MMILPQCSLIGRFYCQPSLLDFTSTLVPYFAILDPCSLCCELSLLMPGTANDINDNFPASMTTVGLVKSLLVVLQAPYAVH